MATTVAGISDPALPGRGWQIFMGVLSLLAGLVTLAAPFTSLWILALVVGSWLIVIGVVEVVTAFKVRTASRRIDAAVAGGCRRPTPARRRQRGYPGFQPV